MKKDIQLWTVGICAIILLISIILKSIFADPRMIYFHDKETVMTAERWPDIYYDEVFMSYYIKFDDNFTKLPGLRYPKNSSTWLIDADIGNVITIDWDSGYTPDTFIYNGTTHTMRKDAHFTITPKQWKKRLNPNQ